ncbi:alpha/beta fold hydrolase [Ahrensia sp. 13_GOM-1096m]|uniref:alpha/beta fold hydrolase n=1 Tax=Ahrensia sp. 13_GOM-1096m TaxID=1380380 RepID=UPI00047D8F72|nr:alpha/beta hydrolase [Ahrensia sp. 13_GOM-1096m]
MTKGFRRWITGAALVGILLIGAPWLRDPETKILNAPDSTVFPGSYADIETGHIRYVLEGPDQGEIVMLVGGLTTSLEFFDETARFLNNAGYRTLRFDIYGRGGSARPWDAIYDRQMFVNQIDGLLAALEIDQPIHVVGQSLGGGISVAWAVAHPETVRSLSIHASAGYVPELPAFAAILDIPWLGDYAWWWIGNGFVSGNLGKYFPEPQKHSAEIASLNAQFKSAQQYRGYRRAVLMTIRNFDAHNMQTEYEQLDAGQIPIQMIWGAQDGVIPVGAADTLIEWMSGTPDLVVLDSIGHMPLLQAPETTQMLVLEHLRKH